MKRRDWTNSSDFVTNYIINGSVTKSQLSMFCRWEAAVQPMLVWENECEDDDDISHFDQRHLQTACHHEFSNPAHGVVGISMHSHLKISLH